MQENSFTEFFDKEYKKNITYKGINLAGVLFIPYFWKYSYQNKKKMYLNILTKIKKYLKSLIKILLLFFPNIKVIKKNIKNNEYDYLIVLANEIGTDNKKEQILRELIEVLEKNKFLILTYSNEIYKYYKKNNFNIIYIKLPRGPIKYNLIKKVKLEYLGLASCYCRLIDILEKIFKEYDFKILLTTQDHEPLDYIATMLAKKNGKKTITHQHGVFLDILDTGYKYFYSDYIMVWGEKSKEFLEKNKISSEIYIIGASKFKSLLRKKENKKNLVLCITNDKDLEKEKRIIDKFNSISYNSGKKVIKLHPSISKYEFIKFYNNLNKEIKISKCYKEIEKAKYLITYKTTAFLDGIILGCSVIDIFFKDEIRLLENSIELEKMDLEIEKREEDISYFKKNILKQRKEFKKYIKSFDSIKLEKKILKKIINEINEKAMEESRC